MACATLPSSLESSPDKTNTFKLIRLIVDGGTEPLRNIFLGKHPGNLEVLLRSKKVQNLLSNLTGRKVITQLQWEKLYPAAPNKPNIKQFDITLLCVLLRNICGLSKPTSGWHTMPPKNDNSLESNIVRIKLFRNELSHLAEIGVTASEFESHWKEISSVLVALGIDQAEIDRLKNEQCGKEEVDRVMNEWSKSEVEVKLELKRIHKTLQELQQTQQMINKSQEYTQRTLQCIQQTQKEEYRSLDEGMHETQRMIDQSQEDPQSTLHGIHQTQKEIQQIHKQIFREIIVNRSDEVLAKLAKCDFKVEVEGHCERFLDGTRQWIFEQVNNWFDDSTSEHRALVISGVAGMGKSVVAAVICREWKKAEQLAGLHFCQHNNARYNNPQLMLQSLASQMCDVLPQYKEALVKQLSRNVGQELNCMDIAELFSLLFKEPFSALKDPGSNFLLVIDGVDESEYKGRSEVVDVIANHLHKLPGWIRFLVTTRPERNITDKLKKLNPLYLSSDDERNLEDIQLFFEKKLPGCMEQKNKDTMVSRLADRAEGLMLYAFFLAEQVKENLSTLDMDNLDTLPQGISAVYKTYFKRLEGELCKILKIEVDNFLDFLSAIAVARQPLPLAIVARILSPSEYSSSVKRNVRMATSCISSLLPIYHDHLNFFHKSVKDWLVDISDDDFSIDEKVGHKILSELCAEELDRVKEIGVTRFAQVSNSLKYALQHGIDHMLEVNEESESVESLIKKYVTELELMYWKLCVDSDAGVEEISLIKEHKAYNMLSESTHETLTTLLFLLSKYDFMLSFYPHSFFQHVLNDGGKELSSEASHLLNTRYRNIPCLEFVVNETVQDSVETRCYSSDRVISFDVSPNEDYMVCRCMKGTIKLFSLETGEKKWKQKGCFPFVFITNLLKYYPWSFYRSVVFHPIENVILPGRLDRVYTITGLCQDGLFSCEGKCTFSFISFSQDKTRILTICPDNNKQVVVWNVKSGEMIKCIDCPCDVVSCAFSSNGKLIATTDSNTMFRVYNVENDCSIKLVAESELSSSDMIIASVCDSDSWLASTMERPNRLFVVKGELGNWNLVETMVQDFSSCSFLPCVSNAVVDIEKVIPVNQYICYGAFFSLLDREVVLIASRRLDYIRALSVSQVQEMKDNFKDNEGDFATTISLDGSFVYQVKDGDGTDNAEFSVVRRQTNEYRNITINSGVRSLVPVKDGVLVLPMNQIPELWNSDVSRLLECFHQLEEIRRLFPISEDLVGCVGENKVDILNISSRKKMSTTTIFRDCDVLACSCKAQALIYNLSIDKLSLWKNDCKIWETGKVFVFPPNSRAIFSPKGDQIVVNSTFLSPGLHILETNTGNKLHGNPLLTERNDILDCSFLNTSEFLICSCANNFLYLVNVCSGQLLTRLDVGGFPHSFSTCLKKPLIAVGLDYSKDFKVVKVWLPGEREDNSNASVRTVCAQVLVGLQVAL